MSKKYTYEEVKEIINNYGFELVDKVYINCKEKLTLVDKDGYYYFTSLDNIIIKSNYPEKFHKYNPYTIQNIKLWLKKNNVDLDLLSNLYINDSHKLTFVDKYGYYYHTKFSNLKTFLSSAKFDKHNPYTLQNIKLWLKLNNINLTLISKIYTGSKNKLLFKDDNGYIYFTNFNGLRKNLYTSIFDKSNLYTIENIELWCKLNNKPFELISKKYKDINKKLEWKCLKEGCGDTFYSSFSQIKSGKGCGVCAGMQVGLSNCLATRNPELASEWHPTLNGDLTPNNVSFSSGKYIWWICNDCGNIWYSRVAGRNNGRGCPECNKSHGEKRCKEVFVSKNFIEIFQEEYDKLVDKYNNIILYHRKRLMV